MSDPNKLNIEVVDVMLVPSVLRTKGTGSNPYSIVQSNIWENVDSIRTQLFQFAGQLEQANEYFVLQYTYTPYTVPWTLPTTLNYRLSRDTMSNLYELGSVDKSIMSILAFYAYGYENHLVQNEIYQENGGCFCNYQSLQSWFNEYIGKYAYPFNT